MSTPQITINLHINLPPVIPPFPDAGRIGSIAKAMLSQKESNEAETTTERFVLVAEGKIVVDNSTGLWWPVEESSDSLDYDAAVAYCRDFRLGGFDDWRMPGRLEVEGILDLDRHEPCLPPVFKTHGGYTWTNTQTPWTKNNTDASRSFFLVGMHNGNVNNGLAYYRFRVRPVRVGGAPMALLRDRA